jgi:Protein of unknown function (DUF4031)
MAVYVDDARIPARVGRIRARWSHLFADSQDELHALAQSIGLKCAWFQPGKPIGGKPSRTLPYVRHRRDAAHRRDMIMHVPGGDATGTFA